MQVEITFVNGETQTLTNVIKIEYGLEVLIEYCISKDVLKERRCFMKIVSFQIKEMKITKF